MSPDPEREERLRQMANSRKHRGTTAGSDVHVLLNHYARRGDELEQLREALEIVGDQDGLVDIPALAAELAELRTEVSHLRSENRRLREQRSERATNHLHDPIGMGVDDE